tara:strand:+ start:3808 stop:4035 length:228 start_codon:yes stop_codon:yes gene_type:complete
MTINIPKLDNESDELTKEDEKMLSDIVSKVEQYGEKCKLGKISSRDYKKLLLIFTLTEKLLHITNSEVNHAGQTK